MTPHDNAITPPNQVKQHQPPQTTSQVVSCFDNQHNFFTPDKNRKSPCNIEEDLTPLAPIPENMLQAKEPTYIQNITNNIIVDNENSRKSDSSKVDEAKSAKEDSKPREETTERKCNCLLGHKAPQYHAQQFPPGYPPHQPYMMPYGYPPYGYPPHMMYSPYMMPPQPPVGCCSCPNCEKAATPDKNFVSPDKCSKQTQQSRFENSNQRMQSLIDKTYSGQAQLPRFCRQESEQKSASRTPVH